MLTSGTADHFRTMSVFTGKTLSLCRRLLNTRKPVFVFFRSRVLQFRVPDGYTQPPPLHSEQKSRSAPDEVIERAEIQGIMY